MSHHYHLCFLTNEIWGLLDDEKRKKKKLFLSTHLGVSESESLPMFKDEMPDMYSV